MISLLLNPESKHVHGVLLEKKITKHPPKHKKLEKKHMNRLSVRLESSPL